MPSPCDNNYTQLGDTRSHSHPFYQVKLKSGSKYLNHGDVLERRIGKDVCGSFVVYGKIETVYRDSVTSRREGLDGLTLEKYKTLYNICL